MKNAWLRALADPGFDTMLPTVHVLGYVNPKDEAN
jgi:hypothetical protein